MTKNATFTEFLESSSAVVLPGAMGTELQRRGYRTALPLWSAQANIDALPLVAEIHADYFKVGASVAVTNTFRTTPRTFAKTGRADEARTAMKRAVMAAKAAQQAVSSRQTFIGGSFAPLEDCYEPDLVPDDETLKREHAQLAEWLAEENVDFLLAETINAVSEARAMAQAASATGLPFIVSFVVDAQGNLLDGSTVAQAVEATDLPGRVAVGLNCRPIDIIDSAFDTLRACCDQPIVLYPNGIGQPHDDLGWKFEENADGIEKFVSTCLRWNARGARIIGGCCGTTPAYIGALANALADAEINLNQPKQA